jgi:RNA polymerase sigma factor (sigma-70 family)
VRKADKTDEALARGVQRGYAADLTILVERHHHALIGFLYRMLGGDRRLAEDLAQETFLRVLRSISGYQYPRPFKPWLYAIAANLARDYFKSADTKHTFPMSDEIEILSEDDTLEVDDGQRARVTLALMTLPEHQREAMILRYYNDLSLSEIAETLRIPVGTVKSRLSLGLSRLKTLMQDGTEVES